MKKNLVVLDTTFRDGAQRIWAKITNIKDVLKAATAISELGVSYLELGFANSRRASRRLIQEALKLGLKAKIAAFGRTHPEDVKNIIKLGVPVGVLVGKTRRRDVEKSLKQNPDDYLQTIRDSIRTLVEAGLEVIFDAEHAFDAWLNGDRDYAEKVLLAATEAGATWIVLCDTNGGINFLEVTQVITEVSKIIPLDRLGVHFHDDRRRASALSELAWELGINHIQGTIGTIGERVGNAPITTFLPDLVWEEQGLNNFPLNSLQNLCSIYVLVCRALNIKPNPFEPWVGENAFATKAGMHTDGHEKDPGSYFHAPPKFVGNKERTELAEGSGASNLVTVAKEFGLTIARGLAKKFMDEFNQLCDEGKDLGQARASFYLWLLGKLGELPPLPKFKKWRTWDEKIGRQAIQSEASLTITVAEEKILVNAEGAGGVDGLNQALRRALLPYFPFLEEVRLADFRPEIFNFELDTAAKVRVIATFTDEKESWTVMGVNADFLEAAWEALWDAYCYRIVKEKEKEEKQ
ncbi:MAG: alpha-isopropylmalate synthase regulatory domain-containing protein [Patescibacteria group bacterium]|nr:alpha-isopropylmalate synthase regulatory domain-containing protein [Patescibacteria group bacterium]MDD5294376.1 alpha-isopropylmalate synthase regulatory domain-containing protein [Patescibacteria group bacterium]MDD5554677.1 alpha-isopropylmalate synthase regulatory domain-containing protein [Patescibacteria group bacterium]